MRTIVIIALFIFSVATSNASTRYLATAADGGSDSNSGVDAAHPWLSPNHALNCGDVIIAKASTAYAAANFQSWMWGTVTCSSGNNVAWLTCATFDGCKIAASNVFAMWISKSYWGVQGWEVSGTGNGGVCFGVTPTGGATIHHIILANNICNGGANGFSVSPQSTTAGVDYVSILGNISYNASLSTAYGNSGITIYEPVKSDSAAGTHIYVAGNFTTGTVAHNTGSYDGNGIALDDLGWVQGGGTAYDQQVVVENNLSVWNGSFGLVNSGNGSPSAHIYWQYNTSAHNQIATNLASTTCGDTAMLLSSLTTLTRNLILTSTATACLSSTQPLYAVAMNAGTATDTVATNWLYSAAGRNIGLYSNAGFVAGTNTTGSDPLFPSQADPGAPNCTGKTNTVDCMSTVIANYKPANVSARTYGYQSPSATTVYSQYYPQWLCAATNIPSGLVTPGCRPVPSQFSSLPTASTDYTCTGTVPCATWPMPPMPAFGGSYSDPTFGTTTWRLAVPPANVNGITFPAYARVQAWNSDNTRMFVMDLGTAGVNMDLYDATTIPPTPINRITMSDGIAPDSADNDVLWSFTNPNRIYYNVGSSTGHGLELRYFDVSTCTSVSCVLTPQVVHTFACTTDATSSLGAGVAGNKIETGSGGQGGMFDSTDTYFSFTCDKVAGDGRHEIDLIRYNRLTDTVTTQTKWYNMCPGAVPSGCHTYNVIGRDASMIRMNQHPDSRYITIIWQTGSSTDAGWVRGEGVEIYDPAYTFLGVASPYDGHQDVGFDVNGVPVLVTVGSFRGNALDERSIGITDLTAVSPTAQTYKRIVLPCSFTRQPSCPPNTYFLGSKPGHISMTGTWGSLPGYALYSNMMVAGPAVAIAPRYPLPTTLGTAVSPGTVTVTPASMSQIGVGVVSMVDTSTSAETVVWTSVTATTATAVFAKTHANTANVYCLSCGETGFAAMENFAVKIDTTAVDSSDAQFWRIGRTMAIRDNEYNAEPHSTVNRDFTQILWGSTWNTDPGTSGPVYGFWTKLALPTRPLPPAVLFKATLTSNADSSVIAATPARKQLTNCATGYSGGSLQPAGVPVGQLYCTVANKTAAEAAGGPVQGVVAATSSGTGIAVVTNGQGAGGTHSPASVLDTYGDSTDDAVCMTDPHRSDPTAIGGIPPSGCVANSSAVFAETSAVGFPFPDTLWPSSYPSNSTVLDTASAYYRDVYFMLPSVSTTHVLEMDVNINSSPTAYAAGKGAYFGWGFQYNVAAQAFQYCPQNCSNWISLRGIDVTGAHADLTTYVLTSNHWYHLRQYGHRVLGCSFTSAVKCYFYDLLTVNDVTAGTAPITYRLVDSGTGQAAGGIPVDNHTWDSGPILQEQIDMVTDNATATAHIVSDTTVFYSAGQNAFWFGMGVN